MKIEGDLDTMKISFPGLRPFVPHTQVQCVACGHRVSRVRQALRSISGGEREFAARPMYCHGDKPPTEEQYTIFGRSTRANVCAGIPVEHLHVTCHFCGAEWLTEVGSK